MEQAVIDDLKVLVASLIKLLAEKSPHQEPFALIGCGVALGVTLHRLDADLTDEVLVACLPNISEPTFEESAQKWLTLFRQAMEFHRANSSG